MFFWSWFHIWQFEDTEFEILIWLSYALVLTVVWSLKFFIFSFFRSAFIQLYFFPLKMKLSNSQNTYRRLVFPGTHVNDEILASALMIEIYPGCRQHRNLTDHWWHKFPCSPFGVDTLRRKILADVLPEFQTPSEFSSPLLACSLWQEICRPRRNSSMQRWPSTIFLAVIVQRCV